MHYYEKIVLEFLHGKAEDMTNCLPAIYSMIGHSASMTDSMAWQFIRWDKVIHQVKSLQSRIVKAVKAQRWNKVKVLQGILTRSYAAKLLAIRRTTENSGKRTAGIDGEKWDTPKRKYDAIDQLDIKGYQPLAVRRIKIPKANGKMRPLGIPTMRDRTMQGLLLLGLEPISETLADHHSYGFRPHRCCADAIEQCFIVLAKKNSPSWVLEGDIKGCFDNISHQWLMDNIPIEKGILKKWLKAGYMEKGSLFPTDEGTPQGSIISPTMANMVLDGLQDAIDKACQIVKRGKKTVTRYPNPYKVHLIRYADDFVVTCSDKSILQTIIKPAIEGFLMERGLELSEEKTLITHINKGFDFLGQTVRKYKGKLLIKPSKKSIKTFLGKVQIAIKERMAAPTISLIQKLNPMIRGWTMYHRHSIAKKTFNAIDYEIWHKIWRWARRRHPSKSGAWTGNKYLTQVKKRKAVFFAKTEDDEVISLFQAGNVKIQRHIKIRRDANPFAPEDEQYFELRKEKMLMNNLSGRKMHRFIYNRQKGNCPICNQKITLETGWNVHHIIPIHLGGDWSANNLVMLHPVCHIQLHQNQVVAAAFHKNVKCV